MNSITRSIKHAWYIFAICLGYAVLRHVILGPTNPNQIPLFIANKAVAFTALVFLVQSACLLASADPLAAAAWGRRALHLAAIHVAMSLILTGPEYYPSFYDMQGILNTRGSVIMLFGALAAYGFWRLSHFQKGPQTRLLISIGACTMVMVHVIPQGIPLWFQPKEWYGRLPDMSLLGLAAIVAALYYFWLQWRRQQ